MSRFIDPNRPYTDKDKKWLLTRPDGEDLIRVNDRRFAHLSDDDKGALTKRAQEDDEKEAEIRAAIEAQQQEEEEDAYHPDDVAQVQDLTIAQLRERLEKEGLRSDVKASDKQNPEDPDDAFTEKEVLSYRVLNFLDDIRKKAEEAQKGEKLSEIESVKG